MITITSTSTMKFDACAGDDTCGDGHGTGVVADVEDISSFWKYAQSAY